MLPGTVEMVRLNGGRAGSGSAGRDPTTAPPMVQTRRPAAVMGSSADARALFRRMAVWMRRSLAVGSGSWVIQEEEGCESGCVDQVRTARSP